MNADPILEKWSYIAQSPQSEIIVPDGCRDLILLEREGHRPSVIVSELDDKSRRLDVFRGDHFLGLRLLPGTRVKPNLPSALLENAIRSAKPDVIRELVMLEPQLIEALAALEKADNTAAVAANIGVSTRTLQRYVACNTNRTPSWWRRLARVRSAAKSLASTDLNAIRLADFADARGFSDQAHMTREFRHWLGVTPARLLRNPLIFNVLEGKGYGDNRHTGWG